MSIVFENNTPWDSAALLNFLKPIIGSISGVRCETLGPQPGVPKARRALFRVVTDYKRTAGNPSAMVMELPSPRVAASGLSALDRLSNTDKLEPHQTMLPPTLLDRIVHAWSELNITRRNNRNCVSGRCDCVIKSAARPLIVGCTKVRIRESKGLDQLEKQYANQMLYIRQNQARIDKTQAKADRLKARIDRMVLNQQKSMYAGGSTI